MSSILVAPDSFKGTFSAPEVAEAMGRGLEAAGVAANLCPVADGGEGTMETLLASVGGRTSSGATRCPATRAERIALRSVTEATTRVEIAAAAERLGRDLGG
jgi:glycerate kinase